MRKVIRYFTAAERVLWIASVVLIALSYALRPDAPLSAAASLIGITSLLLNAKGNPIGQALMIVFSALYGYVSFRTAYYGEMITYLGMTAPMAAAALAAWLRHPYAGKRTQVAVGRLKKGEPIFLLALSAAVTFLFYFILRRLHTANLLPSTLSVATSFAAAYLTARRSPWFAAAYACNDVVLIVLWILMTRTDLGYSAMVICFVLFLAGDLYGLFNWRRMAKKQCAAVAHDAQVCYTEENKGSED